MGQIIKADVYFQDEAPKIGCGWRRCDIEITRNWIRATERATGHRSPKLPKTIYVGQKSMTRPVDTLKWLGFRPAE